MLDGGEDCLMSVSQQHATTSLCLIEASQGHTERELITRKTEGNSVRRVFAELSA